MAERHLNRKILEALEQGTITASCFFRFISAHLTNCSECGSEIDEWAESAASREIAVGPLSGLLSAVSSKPSKQEARRAEEDLRELLEIQSPDRRLNKVDRALTRFRSPLLANLLLDECKAERLRDPEAAEHYVDLAQKVLWRAPASAYADQTRVRSFAHLGAARKARGMLAEAEQAFSAMHSMQRTIALDDMSVIAELCALEGVFLKDRRQLDRSIELLQRAAYLYDLQDDHLERARAQIALAGSLYFAGRFSEAVSTTEEAAEAIDPVAEPLLHLMAKHNATSFLCDAGEYRAAAAQLAENLERYDAVRSRYSIIFGHFHWLAGKIKYGLGQLDAAADHLLRARTSFLQHENRYHAVLVCLDLCLVHLQAGRPDEVLALADLMLNSYAADGLHQEAMAAIRLFAEAARAKSVHTDFVREVFRFLELSQADPTYRCNLSVPDGD